jgi:hypothetical protein
MDRAYDSINYLLCICLLMSLTEEVRCLVDHTRRDFDQHASPVDWIA